MSRVDRDRGSAIVEAPLAIAILLAIAFAGFWLANIGVRHHQLNEAATAASRYAARAYYAPGSGAERRRSREEIERFVEKSLGKLDDGVRIIGIEIHCGADPEPAALRANDCTDPRTAAGPGDYIEVTVTADVTSSDPITAIARSANGLFSSIGAGEPLPESVRATESSIALVE